MLAQVDLLQKLVENGIIAAAFLYILHWLLNKQSRETEENSRYARLTNMEVARSMRSLVSVVLGMQQTLLAHDLTVSGLNPSAGATFEERDSIALKKYTDVMKMLEEQRETIHQLNQDSDVRMDEIKKR